MPVVDVHCFRVKQVETAPVVPDENTCYLFVAGCRSGFRCLTVGYFTLLHFTSADKLPHTGTCVSEKCLEACDGWQNRDTFCRS